MKLERTLAAGSPPAALPRRRLLVLADKPVGRGPSQRFRVEQWAPHLARDHGIDLDFAPFESEALNDILLEPGRTVEKGLRVAFDYARRFRVLLAARRYDAVIVHREAALIGPALFERLIAWSGKPIIFDFDDTIWSDLHQRGNGLFSKLHFFGKTSANCRLAAAVTPGNEYLAAYARQRNANVTVIPTSIDLARFPVMAEATPQRPFVVCWTGSTSTLVHFEHGRRALEALAGQVPLAVKIVCSRPPERPIAGAELRFVAWAAENEAREVGDSHAGIMPLPDDEITRGKCGAKALQCMATGRPVVISPVGMNRELVRSGENGFLAATDEEFVDALLRLARSPELRARIGAAGRRTVEQGFSATAVAARFAEVVRSVTDPQHAVT